MIGELSEIALAETKPIINDAILNIRPEKAMSVGELRNAVHSEFEKAANEYKESMTDKARPAEQIRCSNEALAGRTHPETGVPFEEKTIKVEGVDKEGVFPIFDSKFDAQLPDDMLKATDKEQFSECNNQLKEAIEKDPELAKQFDPDQLEQINDNETPDGYTWHHDAEVGRLQLVDTETHQKTGHTGGRAVWGGGSDFR